MDREERNGVFREASKGRAERRELFGKLRKWQRALVARLEGYEAGGAGISDTVRVAREIAEGLERIGEVQ